MKEETKNLNPTYIYLILSVLIFIFGLFPELVETYYSNSLYPVIVAIQRNISSLFPFAIGDFLYALLLIYALKRIVIFISKNKRTKNDYLSFGRKCLNFVLIIYISFKLLWGLNYSRPSINTQLQISNKHYEKEGLLKLHKLFLARLTQLEKATANTRHQEYAIIGLEDKAAIAYNDLATRQAFFSYNYASVKSVISPWLTSKMGIEGYYNPLSGEANINDKLPAFTLPFVTCHEIAHQLGVAKEDEANLIGYLAAMNSSDLNFQYSAYYNMFRYILFEIRKKYPEDYNEIITKIPQPILNDFETERAFWAEYNGAMSVYMSATFDKILKLNNQTKGIDSYQDIVLWLYNYHEKEL